MRSRSAFALSLFSETLVFVQLELRIIRIRMSASPRGGKTDPSSGSGPGSNTNNGKPPSRDRDRIFALQLRPSRPLTRSNAMIVPRTPDQHLDLPAMLVQQPSQVSNTGPPVVAQRIVAPPPCAPPPSPSSLSRTTTPSLRNVASLSISSSIQSNDYLTVKDISRRRHSDSYFPTKRHRDRRNRLQRRIHHKYSFSPNPRYIYPKKTFEEVRLVKLCQKLCRTTKTNTALCYPMLRVCFDRFS